MKGKHVKKPSKKRGLIIAGAVVATVALAGTAYAALGGTIGNIAAITGTATGSNVSCQTSAMNFDFGGATWDAASAQFQIDRIDFSNFDTACYTNSTPLTVVVLSGGTEYVNYTSTPPSGSGSIYLTTVMTVDEAAAATVEYLVNG